jgi:eukaryotic-like serine/threonine-protein kinase
MAELFLARSTHPEGAQTPVVIKRLLPHMTHDPHFNAMFIDEAKLTARLAHSNIVATLEFNRHHDWLYMVMEYVDGLDALAMLRECARRKVRLPTAVAVYIIHEILNALDFAHNQDDEQGSPLHVVHRDISPSNVLVSRAGEVKLVDFGIARATRREHNTKDGTLKGKYGYMSPEQVVDEELDARSDLFSVGIVLAELLTGRRLFAAPNELDVLIMVRDARLERLDRYGGHIDPDLDRVLRKALSKHPADRFDSAAEFRDALAMWLYRHEHDVTAAVIAAVVDSLYQEAWKRKREHLTHANAARAALVAGVPAAVPQAGPQASQPAGTSPVLEMAAGSVQFLDLEPGEALYHFEHIDGIPLGHPIHTDSMPEVSIEDDEGRSLNEGSLAAALDRGMVEHTRGDAPLALDGSDAVPGADPGDAGDADDAVPLLLDDLISAPVFGGPLFRAEQDGAVPAVEIVPEDSSAIDFDDSVIRSGPRGAAGSAILREAELGLPDDAGEFASSPPIAVLYRLAVARATGLLMAEIGVVRKEIYFHQGIPEFVSSNVRSELFGAYLIDQGVITLAQLERALAEMPREGGKLGDTLIALGLLKPLQVFRLLSTQVRHKLVDVCTWSSGAFRWYGGRTNPRQAFPLDLNAFEILGAGAMQLSNQVVDAWLGSLPPSGRPRTVPSSRLSPGMFQLGEIMDQVCRRLDGSHNLAGLKRHFQESDAYARSVRVLYLLAHTGLAAMW